MLGKIPFSWIVLLPSQYSELALQRIHCFYMTDDNFTVEAPILAVVRCTGPSFGMQSCKDAIAQPYLDRTLLRIACAFNHVKRALHRLRLVLRLDTRQQ